MNKTIVFLFAFVATCAQTVFSAHHEAEEFNFKTVLLQKQDFSAGRVKDLAAAFSVEGFEWRPAEGIRSVKEVVGHVASANYFLGAKLGAVLPEGIVPFEVEKSIASKGDALEALEASYAFARDAVMQLSEKELEDRLDFFGNDVNKLFIALQWADHTNEHLGQLIAYARSSGVVPPWSK